MRVITEEMRTEFRGSSDPFDWLAQSNNADAAEVNIYSRKVEYVFRRFRSYLLTQFLQG